MTHISRSERDSEQMCILKVAERMGSKHVTQEDNLSTQWADFLTRGEQKGKEMKENILPLHILHRLLDTLVYTVLFNEGIKRPKI